MVFPKSQPLNKLNGNRKKIFTWSHDIDDLRDGGADHHPDVEEIFPEIVLHRSWIFHVECENVFDNQNGVEQQQNVHWYRILQHRIDVAQHFTRYRTKHESIKSQRLDRQVPEDSGPHGRSHQLVDQRPVVVVSLEEDDAVHKGGEDDCQGG